MLDFTIYFLLNYTYLFAVTLFLVKVYLFVKHKNSKWRFYNFLYFGVDAMNFSSSEERLRHKKTQNQLTVSIVLFLTIQVALLVFCKP